MMLAVSLFAALVSGDIKTDITHDASLAGVRAEQASDPFAECFEPKLANDPAIRTPFDKVLPFEAMENDVSNEAFRTCVSLLPTPEKSAPAGTDYQRRLNGMRLMQSHNAFYASRGTINLEVRRRIRPYLACIDTAAVSDKTLDANTSSSIGDLAATITDSCQSLKPDFQFEGSEAHRQLSERVLAVYVKTFTEDLLAFHFKLQFGKAN